MPPGKKGPPRKNLCFQSANVWLPRPTIKFKKMPSLSDSSQSTVHYAKPICHPTVMAVSSPVSSNSNKSASPRSPNIRYPTVLVHEAGSGSPKSSPSYAVPVPRSSLPPQYSASQLQYEHVRHRCKMLDEENQKLMKMQSEVVNDANRRVQMHVNEIRMLKEENKKQTAVNKELRDLCCFLDDDRQKTRRLAREWQKFGRYTSSLMKQEVQSYHQKMQNLDEKFGQKERECDELRQLCMYLDEQRQYLMTHQSNYNQSHQNILHNQSMRSDDDESSEDLGCGSSEQSGGSNDEKDYCFNKHKESTLRRLTEQMANSMISSTISDEERKEASKREKTRLLGYIQSLENRIKHLEMSQNHESFWNSSSNIGSECDEKTIIERNWTADEEDTEEIEKDQKKNEKSVDEQMTKIDMIMSMTSSGCTTYASSGTDGESVFVMGDEIDIGNLEVRALSRIEEEGEKTICTDLINENEEFDAKLPPRIGPLTCSSLLNFNDSCSTSPPSSILMRSASEHVRPATTTTLISAKGSVRSCSVEKTNQ